MSASESTKLPAYHPDTNAFLGEVTIIQNRKAYPAWLKAGHARVRQYLTGFRGDLAWIHEREGHAGKAYQPSRDSGLTLDPGVDLGFQTFGVLVSLYSGILTPRQFEAIKPWLEVTGPAIKEALASPEIRSIRISREEAVSVMPFAAAPYWTAISDRFPALLVELCPSSVHTALLSLAYNRGAGNKALEVLRAPLDARGYRAVAKHIKKMQQDHSVPGIRVRRRLEADLIFTELDAIGAP